MFCVHANVLFHLIEKLFIFNLKIMRLVRINWVWELSYTRITYKQCDERSVDPRYVLNLYVRMKLNQLQTTVLSAHLSC